MPNKILIFERTILESSTFLYLEKNGILKLDLAEKNPIEHGNHNRELEKVEDQVFILRDLLRP